MKLWTIQTPDVWTTLRSGGNWRARQPFISPDWLEAYQWLAGQMKMRLGERVLEDQMPVWVWRQWSGLHRPKPDLRSRGYLPAGTRGVRIELEIPEDRVLLSDHDLWHYVLNYWYLPASVRDEREFEAELMAAGLCKYPTRRLSDVELHGRIERSWERIFDLGWFNRAFTRMRVEKTIQGVVWEVRLDDVRAITEFVAR